MICFVVLLLCFFALGGGGNGLGEGGVNGLGQLHVHSLKTGSSHHVQME